MSWLSMFFHKQQKQPNMSAEDCCTQGKISFNAGKYLEAMEFFQAAIEKNSKYGEAYTSLIDTYRILGREHDAQKTLNKLQIEIPNYSSESQTTTSAPPKQKKTSPKQKPTIAPPSPSKPMKSFWEIVFGKPIELTPKDRKSIIAGIIFEILVLFVSLFLGADVGVALFLNLFFSTKEYARNEISDVETNILCDVLIAETSLLVQLNLGGK